MYDDAAAFRFEQSTAYGKKQSLSAARCCRVNTNGYRLGSSVISISDNAFQHAKRAWWFDPSEI